MNKERRAHRRLQTRKRKAKARQRLVLETKQLCLHLWPQRGWRFGTIDDCIAKQIAEHLRRVMRQDGKRSRHISGWDKSLMPQHPYQLRRENERLMQELNTWTEAGSPTLHGIGGD